MKLECKLEEKTFKDAKTGEIRYYNALVFDLGDGSTLDVTIKGDKAKLLKLSRNLNDKMPDKDFWENR